MELLQTSVKQWCYQDQRYIREVNKLCHEAKKEYYNRKISEGEENSKDLFKSDKHTFTQGKTLGLYQLIHQRKNLQMILVNFLNKR